jgi:hypothetical protein
MFKATPGLITIQKFIYLLDELHYKEFATHLTEIHATLPLKLAATIRQKLPGFDSHEELCKKIYGSFEKGPKQNFNQLASYTFRLSNVLAQNYPDYLHHNINRIQRLINEGHGKEANFLAEILLEVAERTDDFQCRIFVINFLSQQAFIVRDVATGVKLDGQLAEVINQERIFVDIQLFTRKVLGEVKKEKHDLDKIKDHLLGFADDASAAIRILSRHSYLLILYQFDLQAFEKPEIGELIGRLEKDLHNHAHVVFPYLLDVRSSLFFMKLNSTFGDLNSKESEREYEALNEHYKSIKYWKSFVNVGQLYLITIQSTRLLGNCESLMYRKGYAAIISHAEAQLIKELISKCEVFLDSRLDAVKYEYEILCYRILHGILLILSGGKNTKAGIDELESLLVAYQQVNLNTETDSIFLCLIAGYFGMKEYDKCAKTFKRYSKSIKGKPVFEVNARKIYAYYYLSQWLTSKSKQYPAKLRALLQEDKTGTSSKFIVEMMNYFEVTG